MAFDIWFDQWTPGDSGTLIHCWWFDVTNDIVRWRTLNITGDVLGTVRTVFTGASAVAGRGAFISGTKTRSGYLYCAYDIDAGAERGLHRSTDAGVTWSANLSTTFVEATLDTCKLFPASGTGDNNDCWALYYDASALALTLKLWDSSAVAQVESATIGVAHTDGPTDLTGQFGFDGAVRHTDGHLIVAKVSGRDVAASAHQVFDCTSTSTITTLTAIAASTDDHYYPQVFINQGTGTIFVAYNGKRDGSEVLDTTTKVYYTYSLNGGTTWNAGDAAYMEGAAGVVQQVWSPMSGSRFYCVWRVAGTLLGNKVNSLIQLGSQLPTIASGSVVNVPTVVPGAVTVVGATITAGSTPSVPSVAYEVTTEFLAANEVDAWRLAPSSSNFSYAYGGQSFIGNGRTLASLAFRIFKLAGATGTVTAELWLGTGSVGSVFPTGSVLVTSAPFDVSALVDSTYTWTTFPMSSTVLTLGTTYVAMFHGSPTATATSQGGGHSGNGVDGSFYPPTWLPASGKDIYFEALAVPAFAPTVAIVVPADQAVAGTTLTSRSTLTVPTVANTQVVTGTTIASGSTPNAPAVAYGIKTEFLAANEVDAWRLAPKSSNFSYAYGGQSFIGNGRTLASLAFRIIKQAGATGTVTAELWLGTGSVGSVAPTGSVLVTSAPFDVSALVASTYTWTTFPMSSTVLTLGTTYVAMFHGKSTAPQVSATSQGGGHSGNGVDGSFYPTWLSTGADDIYFEVLAAPALFAPTVALAQAITGATIGGGAYTDELVYWALNENTGTTSADATGHGYTLTIDAAGSWVTGKFGAAALHCNGSGKAAHT